MTGVQTCALPISSAEKSSRSEDVSEEELVPKRGGMSVVWEYFGFSRDDHAQSKVLCKECRAVVATVTGNTTNLYHHLKHNHKQLYEECSAKKSESTVRSASCHDAAPGVKQKSIAQMFESVTPYDLGSRRHKEITDAITYYLAKDMVPFKTVSKEGFVHLLNKVDKRYKIPSRRHFSHVAVPEMYAQCVRSVQSELKQIEFFACTTDLWSSRTTEPYVSLTVHFINQDFELKSRCLQTSYFPEEHSGENSSGLARRFDELEFARRVPGVCYHG